MSSTRCLVIAHRGASYVENGNTIPAFELARKQGADVIEMDVRQTTDGELVVAHNPMIKLGPRKERIRNLTLQQLREAKGFQLVLLSDVLRRYKNKIMLDIDVKEEGLEKQLTDMILRYKINPEYIHINCSKLRMLEVIQNHFPQARYVLSFSFFEGLDLGRKKRKLLISVVAPLSSRVKRLMLLRFKRKAINHQVYGVSLPFSLIYKRLVETFHKHNINVYAFPVDGEKTMKKLLELGVDGIKTSRPDILKQVIADHLSIRSRSQTQSN